MQRSSRKSSKRKRVFLTLQEINRDVMHANKAASVQLGRASETWLPVRWTEASTRVYTTTSAPSDVSTAPRKSMKSKELWDVFTGRPGCRLHVGLGYGGHYRQVLWTNTSCWARWHGPTAWCCLSTGLMQPFMDNSHLTAEQTNNNNLSRADMVVENACGHLQGRETTCLIWPALPAQTTSAVGTSHPSPRQTELPSSRCLSFSIVYFPGFAIWVFFCPFSPVVTVPAAFFCFYPPRTNKVVFKCFFNPYPCPSVIC